jgi:hypothetical protein
LIASLISSATLRGTPATRMACATSTEATPVALAKPGVATITLGGAAVTAGAAPPVEAGLVGALGTGAATAAATA